MMCVCWKKPLLGGEGGEVQIETAVTGKSFTLFHEDQFTNICIYHVYVIGKHWNAAFNFGVATLSSYNTDITPPSLSTWLFVSPQGDEMQVFAVNHHYR